jgi:hypothetical protein
MPDRIEPLVIGVDAAALDDLRDRVRRARWPGAKGAIARQGLHAASKRSTLPLHTRELRCCDAVKADSVPGRVLTRGL